MNNEIVSSVLLLICKHIKSFKKSISFRDIKLMRKFELFLEEHLRSFTRRYYIRHELETALEIFKGAEIKELIRSEEFLESDK